MMEDYPRQRAYKCKGSEAGRNGHLGNSEVGKVVENKRNHIMKSEKSEGELHHYYFRTRAR